MFVPGDGSEVKPAPTDTTSHCLKVSWPAPHLWLTNRARDKDMIGQEAWNGSLVDGMRDATGQMYMRNRYYDPQSARFTQEDPIGIAGGLNVYGFAGGDPVSYSDPYGLSAQKCPPHCTDVNAIALALIAHYGGPEHIVPLGVAPGDRTRNLGGIKIYTTDRTSMSLGIAPETGNAAIVLVGSFSVTNVSKAASHVTLTRAVVDLGNRTFSAQGYVTHLPGISKVTVSGDANTHLAHARATILGMSVFDSDIPLPSSNPVNAKVRTTPSQGGQQ